MKSLVLASAAALTVLAAPAQAVTIDLSTLVGTYDIQDDFNPVGSFFDNDYFAPIALTAKFTDLYVVGDEYTAFINGVAFQSYTAGANDGTRINDPDTAYNSGIFTRGLISLAAGDTLSFRIDTIPTGYTDATIAVTALPTPEPATWAMMIAGLGIVGYAMRRQTLRVTYAA